MTVRPSGMAHIPLLCCAAERGAAAAARRPPITPRLEAAGPHHSITVPLADVARHQRGPATHKPFTRRQR